MFTMDSTFLFIGQIPVQFTHKPRYPISVFPNYDFSILHLSLFSLRFLITNSNWSKWSDQSHLVITNRSSMYALIKSIQLNISFIFSWKISRELHTSIGKCLYLWRVPYQDFQLALILWYVAKTLYLS